MVSDSRPILLTGQGGQLGRAMESLLKKYFPQSSCVVTSRSDLPLDQPEEVTAFLERTDPGIIINTAAYTAVDKAEQEPDLAHLINAQTPQAMADWCAKKPIDPCPFFHRLRF